MAPGKEKWPHSSGALQVKAQGWLPLPSLLALEFKQNKTNAPSLSLSEIGGYRLVTVLETYLLLLSLLPLGGFFLLTTESRWDAIVNVESDSDPRKATKEHNEDVFLTE